MTIKTALKAYKSQGKTAIALNANNQALCTELVKLTLQDLETLSASNAPTDDAAGRIMVVDAAHPEWGVKPMIKKGEWFSVGIGCNCLMVAPQEFKFWKVVPDQISEDLSGSEFHDVCRAMR